jgi:hypothetical protein
MDGLRDGSPVGPRWKRLAKQKLREVERMIHRSQQLKLLLHHLLRCHCVSLAVCVHRLSLSPDLRRIGQQGKPRSRVSSRLNSVGASIHLRSSSVPVRNVRP